MAAKTSLRQGTGQHVARMMVRMSTQKCGRHYYYVRYAHLVIDGWRPSPSLVLLLVLLQELFVPHFGCSGASTLRSISGRSKAMGIPTCTALFVWHDDDDVSYHAVFRPLMTCTEARKVRGNSRQKTHRIKSSKRPK